MNFRISQSLPLFEEFIETLIFTEFKHNIDVFIVLKVMDVLDNIGMRKSFMDFDLIDQLNEKIITRSLDLLDFRLDLSIILVAMS